jgi:hypothetical protein
VDVGTRTMSTVLGIASDELGEAMSDDVTFDDEQHETSAWTASNFFSPPVCAVAAFTLAVVALLGQNLVGVGISTLLGPNFGPDGGSAAYYIGWGVATAVQFGIVLLLARRSFDATGHWEAVLGRAAVLISGIALVAAVLLVVGGVLHDGGSGF